MAFSRSMKMDRRYRRNDPKSFSSPSLSPRLRQRRRSPSFERKFEKNSNSNNTELERRISLIEKRYEQRFMKLQEDLSRNVDAERKEFELMEARLRSCEAENIKLREEIQQNDSAKEQLTREAKQGYIDLYEDLKTKSREIAEQLRDEKEALRKELEETRGKLEETRGKLKHAEEAIRTVRGDMQDSYVAFENINRRAWTDTLEHTGTMR